jgi:superfamily II DNA/RNA helicase
VLTVYGGVSVDDQTRQLRQGIDLFVGTTGRVLDHIQRGNIDFSNIKTMILDEADQMLKLGFKEDVDKILQIIRKQCSRDLQICLFSATIPPWVKAVAEEHLKKNYKVVDLAQNLKNKTAARVNHLLLNCPFHNRLDALADVCKNHIYI